MQMLDGKLIQFTQYDERVNISTHQYLLLTSKPILVHTGTADAARRNLPEIEKALDGAPLAYIFVSHMGADECGGLRTVLKKYPEAEVIASEHTARQLKGFGIKPVFSVKSAGDRMTGSDFELTFVDYPADPHLYNGLLLMENRTGIFFSSDLMMRAGNDNGGTVHSTWKDEINATGLRQVPNRPMLHKLRKDLKALSPAYVAVGHGQFIQLV